MNEQVNDLTNTERQLIEQAKTISPANFLESIKRQKGSFATKAEIDLVTKYLDKGISKEVINMALSYILVIQNNSIVQKKYIEVLLNNWIQSGLTSAEMVMSHVKVQQKEIKKTKKGKRHEFNTEKIEFNSKEDMEVALKRQLEILKERGFIESYSFEKDYTIKLKY
ncbi:DnaD domain protein [Candidatus Enterococcus murrayae]|uniref:DnaD domain protein n=1 Tax=Candidatus Enterococcus murrayae TaxID=2815321 RepID=A0ABS3HDQ7_9ENTE|nr:DnaD domain protein [Enterococcus sp. MJM16]MBO0451127.1 DnaD domain protein [Enterococcus sp. MJM16]